MSYSKQFQESENEGILRGWGGEGRGGAGLQIVFLWDKILYLPTSRSTVKKLTLRQHTCIPIKFMFCIGSVTIVQAVT